MQEKQIDKLLIRISQGDNAAFEQLYEATKRGVFSFVYSYLKNYADAEDVMQSVYLKIKINIAQYRHGTNARAWILQIAKRQALNELRKRRQNDELCDVPAEYFEDGGTVTELMQRVLDEDERQIVILHVLWGYRHREIAKQLDCPVGTVTSKYNRSLKKMKEALKEAEV